MECQEDFDEVESPELMDETQDGTDPPPKKPGSKAKGRKRTKTGCLTCRKRRIKCGEERPTCSNCTKSKRQCEGYNQRVVFKDPLNGYRPPNPHFTQSSFSNSGYSQSVSRRESHTQSGSSQTPLPIAPKPSVSTSIRAHVDQAAFSPTNERRSGSTTKGLPDQAKQRTKIQPKVKTQLQEKSFDTRVHSHILEKQSPNDHVTHYDFNALGKQESSSGISYSPSQSTQSSWSAGLSSATSSRPPFSRAKWEPGPYVRSGEEKFDYSGSISTVHLQDEPSSEQYVQKKATIGQPIYPRNWQGHQQDEVYPPPAPNWSLGQPLPQYRPDLEDMDDPFDVSEAEDEIDIADEHFGVLHDDPHDTHLKRNDLGIIVAVQAGQDKQGLNLRSFVSFIDRPDMLATYMPSSQSTPLRDQMTARIFCHFVNVTGPCMSLFERHPSNPALMFQGTPVPRSQQHIWAYTFPTLALNNSALLHAMLAIASLHISKLQGGPITASYKHYALSLRRIAKSVSLPTRRGHPATLAAALLLAFYECWAADHQKWSNHLLGAKQLVKEIDFAGMTRQIERKKAQKQREVLERNHYAHEHGLDYDFDDQDQLQAPDEIDEGIIGTLMGRKISYDEYGHIIDDGRNFGSWGKEYTVRDLEIYETQRDLFWWYCKQDTYQSILGGGKLFLDYPFWSHCPPRAPLGRLNAVYGTFDHMILLLGRLANFQAKDLKRKRLAMKANGGRWQPPESMRAQQPAATQDQNNSAPQTPPQMPNFSGMVPDVQEAKLPMGFEPSKDSPSSTQGEELDLHAQTHAANEEWQEIRDGFDLIESHFGEDFQALGPEFSAPIQTPFGPALQYRTYGIAGIWMNLYMGLITCYRCHPSMPPAAIMAAGITARQTGVFAIQLGRIAAGIAPDLSMAAEVNPGVGAALIESSTCMFVSSIQLQDASHRSWTICRLRDVARLTGWQTALAVAHGCETTWMRMGALGKGPVYVRTQEQRIVPDIWASSRRIDRALEGKTTEERRVIIEKSDRVQYALGVMGLEEDFEALGLDDGGRR
ncbi:related to UPC2-regulatory protein involved in control of sterol uptake [Rhynchosporium secalis]|uniref:Related to UPC2-regulatory protein involved in control of sterol uptake n=1 Tax=Rhynchosporium secalis TaxID=38038 RepID=A0A1E1M3S8_RHYSE|nr:related to UPC2-regulatory protein involved in control of sterol uptake [Rhynchosporium secalis]